MKEILEKNKKLAIDKVKEMGAEELQKVNIFISGMEAMKEIEKQSAQKREGRVDGKSRSTSKRQIIINVG